MSSGFFRSWRCLQTQIRLSTHHWLTGIRPCSRVVRCGSRVPIVPALYSDNTSYNSFYLPSDLPYSIRSTTFQMELTDPKLVARLFAEAAASQWPRAARLKRDLLPAPRKSQLRRCRCGRCVPCLDNSRWERIFNEKFADPSYYTARQIHQGSSLDRG